MIPSLLNYTGSKYPILEELYSYFPKNETVMYDLFCGGLSVSINAPDNFKKIYCNDIIPCLINLYQEIQKKYIR